MVLQAGKRGRKVILGGHSLGGSTVDGLRGLGLQRPGGLPRHRRDGADRRRARPDAAHRLSAAQARDRKQRDRRAATRSSTCSAWGCPGRPGCSPRPAGSTRARRPTRRRLIQDYPLLPAAFKPPVRVTNEGLRATPSTRRPSPPDLGLLHVRAGSPRRDRRPAALAGRREHAGPATGPDLRHRARQRGRVVLPARACRSTSRPPRRSSRRRRHRSSACACATPREVNVPLFAFGTDSPTAAWWTPPGASRAARGSRARRSRRPAVHASRPAHRVAGQEPLPDHGRAVPEARSLSTLCFRRKTRHFYRWKGHGRDSRDSPCPEQVDGPALGAP